MDSQLLLWDPQHLSAPVKRIVYDHPPTSLRVSRDGSKVAVGTYDSFLRVYLLPSLECIASYVDLQMVIPHITWRSTHDCLAYNVFQMGKTVVLKPPTGSKQQQQQQLDQQQQDLQQQSQQQERQQLMYY
ncbi:transducin beta-like protein 1 (TgTBL1), putative [Eimeria tenella]|uniref:Transducin beta-like protein 1 (TgTBL1), putative n=1 Tax=Eimeria tenella TaxID=5802 RepID=U6KNW1_EIMTE|nr:transducin beta-like protein 1 (TgTBL1), putative [Eimeria tenella]CDJ39802.1 transducin beta-like protein 1 (TgTBL1), putative [Eimeria tenella]|eukprot:XP_013230555.1 transducin beta-like protein 1 (TgTBL1), putative [Eimeria tenella]